MKLFLAGLTETIPSRYTRRYMTFLSTRGLKVRELMSFPKFEDSKRLWHHLTDRAETRSEFFLDCGAYSAWQLGRKPDLDAYAGFILDRADQINIVANLDVIPGRRGRNPTPLEIEDAAEEGWRNFWLLQDRFKAWEDSHGRGVPFAFIHTFHQGEDVRWLERLLKEGGDYIAISPGNERTTEQKIEWLDEIMPMVTHEKGCPTVRFHGFGVTALGILRRFPFHSVDSAAWGFTRAVGMVSIPVNGHVYQIAFSDRSPLVEQEGKHFTSMCKSDREAILAYLDSKGFTPEELATAPGGLANVNRGLANIIYFLDVEAELTRRPPCWERPRARPRFEF